MRLTQKTLPGRAGTGIFEPSSDRCLFGRHSSATRIPQRFAALPTALPTQLSTVERDKRRGSPRGAGYSTRLNHSVESPAATIASTAPASASRPEISVSFLFTCSRVPSFS